MTTVCDPLLLGHAGKGPWIDAMPIGAAAPLAPSGFLAAPIPKRKPARPPVEEIYPRLNKMVFGVIDRGRGDLNLVFMPQKEAERLQAV